MERFYPLFWFLLGMFATWAILRRSRKAKGSAKRESGASETDVFSDAPIKAESVLVKTTEDSSNAIIMISKAYYLGMSGFQSENIKLFEELEVEIEEFNQRARKLKANTYRIIQQLQHDSIETGHYYVQIVDYLREMAHSIKYVVRPLHDHLLTDHKPFTDNQYAELTEFSNQVTDFLNFALHIIRVSRFEQIDELIVKRKEVLELMRDQENRYIRRIKRRETNSRNSVLYFGVMSETKHLLLQTVNLLKATRDFVSYTKS
jgi:Na+/phosphate symporter